MTKSARNLTDMPGVDAQRTGMGAHAHHTTAVDSPFADITLYVLATCLDETSAQSAAMACVSELAARCDCERVSYGRIDRRGRLRLVAMSNSARLAERSNLVRAIEAAMNEAIEQGHHVVYPARSGTVVADREHAVLARLHDDAPVLTVPVAYAGQMIGALTLERRAGCPFDVEAVDQAQTLATLAGPLLELKIRDAEPLRTRAASALRAAARAVAGPRHAGLKIAAVFAGLLVIALSLATGTHRVTAPAHLEGRVNRAVVAPIDGFVASAQVRAGDQIKQGQVMSRLDDRELTVELSKWRSEAAQLEKQYRGARAAHDRAESAIFSARMVRAEAQIALIEGQLARTELRAPFDGIVVAGDLSQLLGSPVVRGDVLFEVAPLNDYRVVLEVDERDIGYLGVGQGGRLALEGSPATPLPVRVESITPVAVARDGRNYFRVEASVDAPVAQLRPGMGGIAKIEAGDARLLWIWTHRVTNWVRLRLWAWLP